MTDEQLIEELSFPAYRGTSTVIFVPGDSPHGSTVEMVTIDARDLQAASNRGEAMEARRLSSAKPRTSAGAFR